MQIAMGNVAGSVARRFSRYACICRSKSSSSTVLTWE
ncbi:hypothetical protein KP509_34G022700 [Ceratopteris richardii]|uniref:Uncharacterized protein n=1 Tax=Ceratopteris richardii TaxID=49495 RepID=A0A8T2QIM3_CERRI|nr:hypothetical protein KP509_34G022700 [Ceratopteris richardii]